MILSLARVVPIWAWALAVVLAWGAWQRLSATRATQALAAQQVQAEAAKAQAMHAALVETSRRLTAQQEAARAAANQARQARADAADAADAAERLRQRADELAASAAACDPAAAPGGAAASAPGVVLAHMLGRLEARGRDAAAALDAATAAGIACERSYEALTR